MKFILKLILLLSITVFTLNASIFGEGDNNTQTLEIRVSSSHNDAEEKVGNGYMYRDSSDLELTEDENEQQIVGIRFRNINIPRHATITKAYIQFEVDEISTDNTSLTIKGEDTDNSFAFSSRVHDISNRDTTDGFMNFGNWFEGSVSWNPPAWNHENDHGEDQRTPDLKNIVQEIIDRNGWKNGNAMSFIISGSGKRVAKSYDGEHGAAPLLHLEYSGGDTNNEDNSSNNDSNSAMCYALTDDSDRLYKVTMSPNSNSLPEASYISIDQEFNGEGSAYRASNNKFYAFTGVSDDVGPSNLYSIDVETGVITPLKTHIISGEHGTVEGAEFYFDPTLNKEILYVISQEEDSKLYAFDPDNNWALLAGYPKNTNTDLSSLAINPINGVAYAIDDYNYDANEPEVYQLNLKTGVTTHITTLQHLADAEGLAFASDGNLYIEDEGREDLDDERLYMINLQTGELTPSAITNSNGDIEGLSCNGTQMAIDNPTLSLDSNRSVLEGDSNTTDLVFPVTLSKPAVDDIVLHYEITDINTTANEDYILESNLTVLIPKDANSSSIVIKVKGDTDVEGDESFSLRLVDATNAIVDSSSVIGTVLDDDNELSPSLIADYHFDECSWDGTVGEVKDSSGNGFNGTAMAKHNGEDLPNTFDTEKIINRSAKFTKSEEQFVKVTNLNNFNHHHFSSSMWVKVHENVEGWKWQTLLHKGNINNSADGVFKIKYNNNHGIDRLAIYTTFSDNSTDNFFKDQVGLKDKQWHHIVVTYENREYKIYFDKTLIKSKSYNKDLKAPNNELHIGGKAFFSNMFIDEVKIFNGALNNTDINNTYSNELAGKNWDGTDREAVMCTAPQEHFTCDDTLFISNRSQLGTGGNSNADSGATWLHSIDRSTNPYAYNSIGEGYVSDGYNAMGYNVKDDFIYALDHQHLLKIDKNGVVKNLGPIEGLPASQLYSGEFDRNGSYYVGIYGGGGSELFKIDIDALKVTKTIPLTYENNGSTADVKFWDMAIDKTGNYFYMMLLNKYYYNDKFAKLNISTGKITIIDTPINPNFSNIVGQNPSDINSTGVVFSDKLGKVYAQSDEGGFYQVDTNTGKVYELSSTQPLTYYNDATSCPDAIITEPPHLPRLSINNVSKLEGDSGETTFNFTVTADKSFNAMPMSGAMFYYRVVDGDGNEVVSPHEVALSSDHDFKPEQGIGIGMSMFSNGVSVNIPVTVYGDKKVERDEEFYVEIYSPQLFTIDKNIGIGTIINDDNIFNIERVNSYSENNQTQKESLYTQIAGKDFDYSIVSYFGPNINTEYDVQNILFKIELIDMNTTDENKTLYTKYYYADELKKRFPIVDSNDLKIQRATRKAQFKISYIVDVNGTKISEYNSFKDAYESLENNSSFKKGNTYSRDSFAIRPASYRMKLNDNDLDENNQTVTYAINDNSQNNALKLVAEYDYNLTAKAVIEGNNSVAIDYNTTTKELNITLDFDETGITSCADTNTSEIPNYSFQNGELNKEFSHDNVGKYTLHIEDINWTHVDKNPTNLGCIINSSSNIADDTGKFGCNIASNEGVGFTDINMTFQAYEFKLNDTVTQNPYGHNYVYMNNLGADASMGIDLFSNIYAQGYKHKVLTNFTKSCMAEDVNIMLHTDFNDVKNTSGYGIRSYNDNNISAENINVHLLTDSLVIPATKFLDANEGNSSIRIRYNIGKEYNQTMNPVNVKFTSYDVNSSYLEESKPKVSHINKIKDINSSIIINNQSQLFYYARVSSYVDNYQPTNKTSINTPLFVEVYCRTKTINQDWCRDTMKLTANGIIMNGQKTYRGWYLVTGHNSADEGNIKSLNSDNGDISTNLPASTPFTNGKINNVQTLYTADELKKEVKAKIEIKTDDWLKYKKENVNNLPLNPSYSVVFQPVSGMVGVNADKQNKGGLGYNLMRDNNNSLNGIIEKNGKMSW